MIHLRQGIGTGLNSDVEGESRALARPVNHAGKALRGKAPVRAVHAATHDYSLQDILLIYGSGRTYSSSQSWSS